VARASPKTHQKLHNLHTLSYLHYDVQPEHFRIVDNEIYLFDFGLSCKINKTNVLYKGGLIHFQSIEVCNYVLQENEIIDYNIKSEVYAHASTLFFLYSEQTVVDYDFELSLKEKLDIIAKGKPRTFEEVRVEAFPEFEAILQACLNPDLDKRISDLSEVITALEKAMLSLT